jgi:hypothetical protein
MGFVTLFKARQSAGSSQIADFEMVSNADLYFPISGYLYTRAASPHQKSFDLDNFAIFVANCFVVWHLRQSILHLQPTLTGFASVKAFHTAPALQDCLNKLIDSRPIFHNF